MTTRKRASDRPLAVSQTPTAVRAQAPADLDWTAFRARYFPGRRPRHDFKAAVAYGIYKKEGRRQPSRRGTDELKLEHTALHAWEDEGGAARDHEYPLLSATN